MTPAFRHRAFWLSLRDGFTSTTRHLRPNTFGQIEPIVIPDPADVDPGIVKDLPALSWLRVLSSGIIQGPVLWFVHGYNAEYPVAAKAYRQMRAAIDSRVCLYENATIQIPGPKPWRPRTIMQVLWTGGWSGLMSFAPAWHRAKTAGRLLANAVAQIADAMVRHPSRRREDLEHRFVGHSMGCRVLGEMFNALPNHTHKCADFRVFLANAAIDKDALDREYTALWMFSRRCVAFTSHRDPVLKLYPAGRALTTLNPGRWGVPALGLGVQQIFSNVGRAHEVDYSSDPEHATDHGGARKTNLFYQHLLA